MKVKKIFKAVLARACVTALLFIVLFVIQAGPQIDPGHGVHAIERLLQRCRECLAEQNL